MPLLADGKTMTEQEAKTKWCPMVRHVGPKAPLDSTPQDAVHNNGAHCKGAQCMMWRWDGWTTEPITDGKPDQGHCGLAGKP
jgi:hypothetical protein